MTPETPSCTSNTTRTTYAAHHRVHVSHARRQVPLLSDDEDSDDAAEPAHIPSRVSSARSQDLLISPSDDPYVLMYRRLCNLAPCAPISYYERHYRDKHFNMSHHSVGDKVMAAPMCDAWRLILAQQRSLPIAASLSENIWIESLTLRGNGCRLTRQSSVM